MAERGGKVERIDAELAIDLHGACALLSKGGRKITPATHWVRVTHEVTRDAAPWALVRFQAISRGVEAEAEEGA
jgi:hypothetical protein